MNSVNKKSRIALTVLVIIATLISGLVLIKPFGSTFPSVSIFGTCSADNISGATKIGSTWVTQVGNELTVQGWAADVEKKTVASDVSVQLIDSRNNVIETWVSKYDTVRADVVAVFQNPAMDRSGMNVNIGPIALAGLYKIQLGSINDGQYQICTLPISIQAKD